jgi:hypothetical protein
MYVTSKEGVRERSEPYTDSQITRTRQYGEMIQLFARQNKTVTINGITDYWYRTTHPNTTYTTWIFGGYLSEELPKELPVIIGWWDVIDNRNMKVSFYYDYFFFFGLKEETGSGIWGVWEMNKTRTQITVNLENEDTIYIYIQFKVIDKNNIELSFSRELFGYKLIKLKRNLTGL